MRKRCISIIGAGDADPEDVRIAEDVGREIAANNAILICGGLGGVMYHAAKGAKEKGGLTIGILPGDDRDNANPFIDIPIVTGLGYARNVIVAYSGEAIIAVGGRLGTLSEIAFALIKERPVIGINTWKLEQGRMHGKAIIMAKDAKDAVKKALEIINK